MNANEAIRMRPSYHVARVWLAVLNMRQRPRHRTKGLLVGLGSVELLMRESLPGFGGSRHLYDLVAADQDFENTLRVALMDAGYKVDNRPQRWCEGRHQATNLHEAALWSALRANPNRRAAQ